VLSCFFASSALGSQRHGILIVFALVIVLGAGMGVGLLFYQPSQWLPTSVLRQLKRVRLALWRVLRNYRLAIFALALSLCIQSCFVLLNAFLGNDIGIMLPLGIWFFAWPLAKLTALMPISLGGLGVQELALTGLLKPFGVTPSQALAQALLWRGVFVATGLAGGFIWITIRKAKWLFTNVDVAGPKKRLDSIQTTK
ncbi:MAG: flippase-like domain-containing protein, partial [Alteromonas sp.]|nr:flippase-like domain-containing protein [Alteromonas sp.]